MAADSGIEALLEELEMEKIEQEPDTSQSDRLVIGLQEFWPRLSILHVIAVNQVKDREAQLIWALTSSFSSSAAF